MDPTMDQTTTDQSNTLFPETGHPYIGGTVHINLFKRRRTNHFKGGRYVRVTANFQKDKEEAPQTKERKQ